ncbi:MAG TPA: AAA family ATPase [Streptosporangiaceae bacterium]|jgi:DNA-binding CsgD family transcriptional regulator
MDLLERSAPLSQLDSLLAATVAGGRVALVTGEAGIGKSALVRRFAERQATAARFLVGTCDPLLIPRALGPLHDLARQTGGRLARMLAAESPREQLFAALLDELEQPNPPRVIAVEDAHWADEATLDLLVFLGRRMERTRALLLVTYRDDELAAGHPLRAVVGSLPKDAMLRVRLQPLSDAAVEELARQAGRPAAGLHSLTGGNPLLVTEVLASGEPGVPMNVRDLMLARLGRVSDDAQELARLVAVVPARAELWLLEEALRPAPLAVEPCVTAGLLVAGDEAVGFRHELLRRAVEGSLSAVARRELNRKVLRVLAGTQRGPADVTRLVHHAREARDVEAVLRYAPRAAAQAAAVGAHNEALGHYRVVLQHAGRLPAAVRADLLEGCSVEAYVSGFAQEALAARRAALPTREAQGDPDRLGESLRWLSRLSWYACRRDEAETAAARAVAVLERGEPGHQLAMAYSNQAQLDMLADRAEAALAWASRAIELARRLGDPEALSHALTNAGSVRLWRGDPVGRAELEQAFEVALAAGLEDHAARALNNLAGSSVDMRDYRHASGDIDRALGFAVEHDLAGYTQCIIGIRARLRLEQGDWVGAERGAEAALGERGRSTIGMVCALLVLALLRARRGDPEAAATLQEATDAAFATGELQWIGPVAAARAEHAWLRGETALVAEEASHAFEAVVAAGHPWFAGELALWLWQAGALAQVPVVVAEPYQLLLDGDWRGAAEAWQALGCPYAQAQALACADRDEGALEALRLFDDLGAGQAARRLRGDLRRRGVRRIPRGPRPATAANPAGLTGRQLEVLTLLSSGLSNPEIAARLSLSARTVDHHVLALLAKLGARSRRQVAAAACQLKIIPA